jgi:hypothetical protein
MTKPASTPILAAISTLPVIAACALLGATGAHAEVELSFSGTVATGSTIPGATDGAAITFDVFADNGGASLISQTWDVSDITSATIQAGTYSAATSGPQGQFFTFGSFSTNASGQLQTLDFGGNQSGSDTNGNTEDFAFAYVMNGANPIWFLPGGPRGPNFGAISPPSITNTTISLVSTPEIPLPAALPLFATGLGGLGMLGWRKKRRARGVA